MKPFVVQTNEEWAAKELAIECAVNADWSNTVYDQPEYTIESIEESRKHL